MDYYKILQVSPKATDSQIKSSYKSLVKKYHPDLYKGDKSFAEQKIKEINAAYDVLSNPEAKAEYDEYLSPKPQQAPSQTSSHSSQPYHKNAYQAPKTPQWSFTDSIEKEINKLENKKQTKLIIIIFFIFLLLFLINIIQTLHFLQNKPDIPETQPIPNEPEIYYYWENKTLDELFYEMMLESEKAYYNQLQQQQINP